MKESFAVVRYYYIGLEQDVVNLRWGIGTLTPFISPWIIGPKE